MSTFFKKTMKQQNNKATKQKNKGLAFAKARPLFLIFNNPKLFHKTNFFKKFFVYRFTTLFKRSLKKCGK